MKSFKSALEELASPDWLAFELKEFYEATPSQKKSSSGVDGISLAVIGKKNPIFVKELSRSLLSKIGSSERFEYSPLWAHPIPKSKETYRIICVPTVRDRLVQKAVLRYLDSSGIEINSSISYGSTKGRGVKTALEDALALRMGKRWVFKTDISSYFDTIDRDILKECVKSKIRTRSLHHLLFGAIDAEISPNVPEDVANLVVGQGIRKGKGLRQGLPLSPFLSNLYLSRFDMAVAKRNFSAIRYVDDLIFFSDSKSQCEDAYEFCVREFEKYGLKIPELGASKGKTVICAPNQRVEFLGLEIAQKGNGYTKRISDSQMSRINSRFEALADIDQNLSKGLRYSDVSRLLNSLENSYKGYYGDADNYDHFLGCLRGWRRKTYVKLLESGLKVKVDELEHREKVFFHLADIKKIKKVKTE